MNLIPRPPGFTGTPDDLPTADEMDDPRAFDLMATWGYTAERAALVVEEHDRDRSEGAVPMTIDQCRYCSDPIHQETWEGRAYWFADTTESGGFGDECPGGNGSVGGWLCHEPVMRVVGV